MNRVTKGVMAAALAVSAAGVVAGTALPSASRTGGPQAPITIAVYRSEKGIAIWDGGPRRIRQVRFLAGADLAAVSPSGASVAYVRDAGNGFDLFHSCVYGGHEAKLAHVAGSRQTALAFSPDSRTIAFASPRGIELTSIVAGRKPRVLPRPPRWRGSSFQALQFSPDRKRLAFSRTWGNGRAGTLRNELAVVRVDGRDARSLATNPEPFSAQYRPSFSPD